MVHMPERNTVERETTSIKVRPDVWRDAKIEAIRHGQTVSQLVEEAIEAWVKHRKN
jgi:predicted HicB family RNase H-like nuclease